MTTAELITKLRDATKTSTGWQAKCPAHEDQTPSLSVKECDDGRTLINCHAGCTIEKICASLEIRTSDLFARPARSRSQSPGAEIATTYNYVDADGKVLFQVCRMHPKGFRQRRPDGNDGWVWKLQGVRRVLYNLDHLEGEDLVVIVEGEKDADRLCTDGIMASTSPGGAGKWRDEYSEHLTDKRVAIVPDNDAAGRQHASQVLASVRKHARSAVIVELPELPDKGDVSDWLDAGHTVDELQGMIREAEEAPDAPGAKDNEEPAHPLAHYDAGRKEYVRKNSSGRWLSLTEGQFKRYARSAGYSTAAESGGLSPADTLILEIQDKHDVSYVGALAGHAEGLHEQGGIRCLVTSSPRIIPAASGEWPVLRAFLERLLGGSVHEQLVYLFGWLKTAYEALVEQARLPGQAVVFGGPHNCGKSLLQNLITEALGGRAARPYQFMANLTAFNADLFGAEHLLLEDEQPSRDIRARSNLGAQIKNLTVNELQRCHAKGRTAVHLRPQWRLTISVNDEPENLLVLPPIDDGIADKIIILKAAAGPMPMPTNTPVERAAFWNTLVAELPAFLYFLREFKIPVELQSPRFGIKHFHHPDILGQIDALSPEHRLLALIDLALFAHSRPEWLGTALDLERVLRDENFSSRREADRLLSFGNTAGVYLGRLAKKCPLRVRQHRTADRREWFIRPPEHLDPKSGSDNSSDRDRNVRLLTL